MSKILKCSAATGLVLATIAGPVLASSHREAPGITEMPKVDNTDVYAFRSYEPGRDAFVTLIANFQPDQGPGSGPNYFTMDPDAIYEIHIDNTGDAVEDLTYQFKFTNTLKGDTGKTVTVGGKTLPIPLRQIGPISDANDANLGEDETYTVTQITSASPATRRSGTRASLTNTVSGPFYKPFDNAGNKSIPNYPAYGNKFIYNVAIPGCANQGRVFRTWRFRLDAQMVEA